SRQCNVQHEATKRRDDASCQELRPCREEANPDQKIKREDEQEQVDHERTALVDGFWPGDAKVPPLLRHDPRCWFKLYTPASLPAVNDQRLGDYNGDGRIKVVSVVR